MATLSSPANKIRPGLVPLSRPSEHSPRPLTNTPDPPLPKPFQLLESYHGFLPPFFPSFL